MNKELSGKSDYKNLSNKELYLMLYEGFRLEELKYILKKIDLSQREFLSKLQYKSFSPISKLIETNKKRKSGDKQLIKSSWVDILRYEMGDEKLLILRDLFKTSNEYKLMIENDEKINAKLN